MEECAGSAMNREVGRGEGEEVMVEEFEGLVRAEHVVCGTYPLSPLSIISLTPTEV